SRPAQGSADRRVRKLLRGALLLATGRLPHPSAGRWGRRPRGALQKELALHRPTEARAALLRGQRPRPRPAVDEQDRQARRDQFAARRPDAFMTPAWCDADYYD